MHSHVVYCGPGTVLVSQMNSKRFVHSPQSSAGSCSLETGILHTCVLYRTTAKFESMHLNWPALRKVLNPQLSILASALTVHLEAPLTNWPVSSIEPLSTPWMATNNSKTKVVLLGAREWHNNIDRASTRHNMLHRHSDESAFLQNGSKRIWFEQLFFAFKIICTC